MKAHSLLCSIILLGAQIVSADESSFAHIQFKQSQTLEGGTIKLTVPDEETGDDLLDFIHHALKTFARNGVVSEYDAENNHIVSVSNPSTTLKQPSISDTHFAHFLIFYPDGTTKKIVIKNTSGSPDNRTASDIIKYIKSWYPSVEINVPNLTMA